jgi:hypothetical protein
MNHQHMDRIEQKIRDDAERGGVGNMPNMPEMPEMNLTTDMDHSLGDDLGGKFGD